METEKDRLERRISALAVAMEAMAEEGEDTTSAEVTLATLKDRLAALTRSAIKDGVLGRWEDILGGGSEIHAYREKDHHEGYTFHPLTIEELLPTLAQWVPGAVRWRYSNSERITIETESGEECGRIPAPPRDDWETVGGEL